MNESQETTKLFKRKFNRSYPDERQKTELNTRRKKTLDSKHRQAEVIDIRCFQCGIYLKPSDSKEISAKKYRLTREDKKTKFLF